MKSKLFTLKDWIYYRNVSYIALFGGIIFRLYIVSIVALLAIIVLFFVIKKERGK